MMPKMNGLEVLKTIRDKENLIPILMLLLSKRAIEPVAESYENIDQRFDSKRWKMLQIGTFFIRIYEKNITKWFTYEKWGSKLEVVGKKWN